MSEIAWTHKAVSRIRSIAQDASGRHLFQCRNDNFFFFFSQQTFISRMRIQRKYGNARCIDSEVLFQRLVEDSQFLLYQFLRYSRSNLTDRDMPGNQCHPEIIFHQNHQWLGTIAQSLFYIFRMTGKCKSFRLNGMLVDGSCDNHVNQSLFIFLDSSFQSTECSLSGFRICLWEFYFHFIIRAVHYTQTVVSRFRSRAHDTEVRRQIEWLAMISCHLRGAINNRCTQFQHNGVGECFQNNFITHTVYVSLCNADFYFIIFHFSIYISF